MFANVVKRINSIFADKGNSGTRIGASFITSSRSDFFNETDFKLYFFKEETAILVYRV